MSHFGLQVFMTEGIKRTPLNLSGKQQNIRSHTAINQVNWYHVHEVIKENCCVSQQEQADETNISHEPMQAMAADQGHQKVCARWYP
jgi:hypothetical protein